VDRKVARAFLGVGSSLHPEENIRSALRLLAGTPALEISGISIFYRTSPLPAPGAPQSLVEDDPDFLNGVLEIRTTFSPEEVDALLTETEDALGRVRPGDKYAPRTMDLDLLLYFPEHKNEPGHTGPEPAQAPAHPDIRTRAWVAWPLSELAPELLLPPDDTPLREIAAGFPGPGGSPETDLTQQLRATFFSPPTRPQSMAPSSPSGDMHSE